MKEIDLALSYLNRDRVLHANMLEVLRRGSFRLLGASSQSALLLDTVSEAYLLSASTAAETDRLLTLLPPRCDLLVGHQLEEAPRIQRELKFPHIEVCYSSAYLGTIPLPIPFFDGELRLLDPSWAQWVYDHYSHPFGDLSYYQGALERGMLGAFYRGSDQPAGFVGFHEEGSIGMLEVLSSHRRKGLGTILQSAAVNLALKRGSLAFGQIFEGNEASLALQQKIGMSLSAQKIYWLIRDE